MADQDWPQSSEVHDEQADAAKRGAFSSRKVFIFAAIGEMSARVPSRSNNAKKRLTRRSFHPRR